MLRTASNIDETKIKTSERDIDFDSFETDFCSMLDNPKLMGGLGYESRRIELLSELSKTCQQQKKHLDEMNVNEARHKNEALVELRYNKYLNRLTEHDLQMTKEDFIEKYQIAEPTVEEYFAVELVCYVWNDMKSDKVMK